MNRYLLPLLLPSAKRWCEMVSRRVLTEGQSLSTTGQQDARSVGVRYPERVRVALVERMPFPLDPPLAVAAHSLGFLSSGTIGMALGYAVIIRRERLSRRLLSHECRHVAQCESEGSLGNFLDKYLREVLSVGYQECSFEVDARMHELQNADLRWRPLVAADSSEG